METLEQFEEWDQILKLTETHYIEPTDNEKLQAERLLLVGRSHFEKNSLDAIKIKIKSPKELPSTTTSKKD